MKLTLPRSRKTSQSDFSGYPLTWQLQLASSADQLTASTEEYFRELYSRYGGIMFEHRSLTVEQYFFQLEQAADTFSRRFRREQGKDFHSFLRDQLWILHQYARDQVPVGHVVDEETKLAQALDLLLQWGSKESVGCINCSTQFNYIPGASVKIISLCPQCQRRR